MRKIGMLDLKAEYELFVDELRDTVNAVLDSQQFINGPAVAGFEGDMRERIGVAHAVAVSSGSDALLCTLMALELGPGDEVIVPPFTFFATAGCVARTGATPVFADIDPRTFNIDPAAIEAAITDRTRAIIVVHLFGQCAQMDAINEMAARRGLSVVEDAAQAIGASLEGTPACRFGRAACISFYPTKNLGGLGEGGMIFTDDEALATLIRQLRNHGESGRYQHERIGGNFRLDTLKAAMLQIKLKHFDTFTANRRRNAGRYDELLADLPVETPYVSAGQSPVYHQYSILTDQRDELRQFLTDRGVGSGIYYPIPLHLQPCFASLGYQTGQFPVTERTSERILSLPVHPMLADEDLCYVVSCIAEFHGASKRAACNPQAVV